MNNDDTQFSNEENTFFSQIVKLSKEILIKTKQLRELNNCTEGDFIKYARSTASSTVGRFFLYIRFNKKLIF